MIDTGQEVSFDGTDGGRCFLVQIFHFGFYALLHTNGEISCIFSSDRLVGKGEMTGRID